MSQTRRLHGVAPELAARLGVLGNDALRSAAEAAARVAVDTVRLEDRCVEAAFGALSARRYGDVVERAMLEDYVSMLDERAWDLQDAIELGLASDDYYAEAFNEARAAAALLAALGADASSAAFEAAYEAQAATEDVGLVERRIEDALRCNGA
jgi:hypothetical protein